MAHDTRCTSCCIGSAVSLTWPRNHRAELISGRHDCMAQAWGKRPAACADASDHICDLGPGWLGNRLEVLAAEARVIQCQLIARLPVYDLKATEMVTFAPIVQVTGQLEPTATLVREDERIVDLQFLVGTMLCEANWLDLRQAEHIATASWLFLIFKAHDRK